jgi:hypothetical protein
MHYEGVQQIKIHVLWCFLLAICQQLFYFMIFLGNSKIKKYFFEIYIHICIV